MKEQTCIPRLIAFELTRNCSLKCLHCRADAGPGPTSEELKESEIYTILKNIAGFSLPVIILTGGEPLMREDIFRIASFGTEQGLRMVLATCGMMVNEDVINKLKEAGIQRISISLDGADTDQHDGFRGVPGAFRNAVQAAESARKLGLPFQINTTVHKDNVDSLPEILQLSVKLGAVAFHPFFLVPTGRAKKLRELEIPPKQYEDVLNWVAEQQDHIPLQFKPTCAPHYNRILKQKGLHQSEGLLPGGHPGGASNLGRGCMGGKSFAFISSTGKIQICGFLDVEGGDLRKEDLNFKRIWDTSPLFRQMRNYQEYQGKCGECSYLKICSGCRARAYSITGDYMAAEPYCIHIPGA